MIKELLFGNDGLIAWSAFFSVLYFLFGSQSNIKKYIVISWAAIITILIILYGFGCIN